jgi:hypothetical protein
LILSGCGGYPTRAVFVPHLLSAEYLYKKNFKLGAYPHAEFKGDILVGIGSAIPSGTCPDADAIVFQPIL